MSSSFRLRVRRAVQLYPVTAGALVALTVAAVALVLVLSEQGKGRERDAALSKTDAALAHTDSRLATAIRNVQASRREAVIIGCRTNRRQNKVLLSLISLSIAESKKQGRVVNPQALAATRKLLAPITPQATRRICKALLKRVDEGPPPPP